MASTLIPNGNCTVNITGGGAGGSGQYLVTGAGGGGTYPTGSVTIAGGGSYSTSATTYNWTSVGSNITAGTNFTNTNGKAVMTIPHGEDKIVLEEKATLEVKGNVKINGIDLEERLKTIEKVLQIPERDAKLEAKYPKLKKMYDDYINALGKYRTFESIKGEE
jgi:hypothetical protein